LAVTDAELILWGNTLHAQRALHWSLQTSSKLKHSAYWGPEVFRNGENLFALRHWICFIFTYH